MIEDKTTLQTETDDVAAPRQVLVGEVNAAIAAQNTAAAIADERAHVTRDCEWIAASAAADTKIWGRVADALAKLPSNASNQEIALAQARAIFQAKAELTCDCTDRLPAMREALVAAVVDFHLKQQAVEAAMERVEPTSPWAFAASMRSVNNLTSILTSILPATVFK